MSIPEGIVQYRVVHRHESLVAERWRDRLSQLTRWRDRLRDFGLIGQEPDRYGGYGFGNLSCRADSLVRPPGRRAFLVSAVQTSGLEWVDLAHFALVEAYDARANRVISRGLSEPSSESLSHGAVYDLSPEIGAVLHVHSPKMWSTAEVLGLPATDNEALAGTPQMAEAIARLYEQRLIGSSGVFAMGGHEDGLLAFGRDLDHAGDRLMEICRRSTRSR